MDFVDEVGGYVAFPGITLIDVWGFFGSMYFMPAPFFESFTTYFLGTPLGRGNVLIPHLSI